MLLQEMLFTRNALSDKISIINLSIRLTSIGGKMRKLYIVMYHYVRDLKHSRYPEIKGLDFELFKNQIRYLKGNFNIVTMEDVIESINTRRDLPDKSVLLTFDDGYADHYMNVFPVLKTEGVQGSFFIPGKTFAEYKLLDVNKIHFILASANIDKLVLELFNLMDFYRGNEYNFPTNDELYFQYAIANRYDNEKVIFVKRILQTVLPEQLRKIITSTIFEKYVGVSEETFAHELYMNKEQIKCMKEAKMHIGIHGYDHYWLGNLSIDQMKQDILKAKDVLADFLDEDWVMNYPYGNYSDEVIEVIKANGCVLGMSTEVRLADLDMDNRYALPRLDTNDFPPKSDNYKMH